MASWFIDLLKDLAPDSFVKGKQVLSDEFEEIRTVRARQKQEDRAAKKKIKTKHAQQKKDAMRAPQEPEQVFTRPTTMQEAIDALATNNYPAAHITCPDNMSEESILAFADAIMLNTSITSIDMGENHMSQTALEALHESISANPNIIEFTWEHAPHNATNHNVISELHTSITDAVTSNVDRVEQLTANLLNLKGLFNSASKKDVSDVFNAINARQSAVFERLTSMKDDGEIPMLGSGGADQLFVTATMWKNHRYMHELKLDIPTAPAEALTNLVYETQAESIPAVTQVQVHHHEAPSEGLAAYAMRSHSER